jgi:hypothetical protein
LRRITPLNALYWLLLFAYLGLWGRLANQYPILFDDGSLYSMAYAHNAGATFFDGLVENRPPLLMTAVAWVFQVAPDVRVIRWLSVVVFAGVLGCVYLTLRFATGRKDVSICGVTLLATNYAVRDYGIVEISLSFWQASMCLCVLVLVFRAVALGCDGGRLSRQVVGLLLAAGMLWGAAFFTKQQSIVVLPALIVVVAVLLRGQQWEHAALALVTFIAAAAISVSALYYFLLAGAGIDDTYKYLVAANMHRNAAIPWDVAWWSRKAGVATDMLVMSSRIALGSIVALEFLAWIERASPRLIIAFGQRSSEVSNTRSPESVFRQRTVLLASGVAVWVVTAVTFYFFQINAHAHYLLEIGVAVALLAPLGLAATARYSRASIVLLNAAILAAMFVWHGFVREPVGEVAREKVRVDNGIADVIRRNSGEDERLLLFGMPALYFLSQRLPASRFLSFVDVWTSDLLAQEYTASIIDSLERQNTKIVAIDDRIRRQLPGDLEATLASKLQSDFRVVSSLRDPLDAATITIYARK